MVDQLLFSAISSQTKYLSVNSSCGPCKSTAKGVCFGPPVYLKSEETETNNIFQVLHMKLIVWCSDKKSSHLYSTKQCSQLRDYALVVDNESATVKEANCSLILCIYDNNLRYTGSISRYSSNPLKYIQEIFSSFDFVK